MAARHSQQPLGLTLTFCMNRCLIRSSLIGSREGANFAPRSVGVRFAHCLLGVEFIGEFGALGSCGLRLLLPCREDLLGAFAFGLELCGALVGVCGKVNRTQDTQTDKGRATNATMARVVSCRKRYKV